MTRGHGLSEYSSAASSSPVRDEATGWPRGDSEMAARIAAFDWSATPLGPIGQWPQSLRNAVDLMIGSPQFATLAWGPTLTLLYNDACTVLFGTRHPTALGRTYTDVWHVQGPEDVIGETLSGRSTHFADQFLDVPSRVEQPVGWFTGSRTPLRDENGVITGFYVTSFETTERVLAERAQAVREGQQAFLLKLSDTLRPLSDPYAIQREACRLLGAHLDVDYAYYVQVDERAGFAVIDQDFVRGDRASLARTYPLSEIAWTIPIYKQGRPIVVPDVARLEGVPDQIRPAIEARGLLAWIGAPLVKHGELAGALNVMSGVPRAWSEADVTLVSETGERIWAAIERARAERAAREADTRLRTMADAAPVLMWDFDSSGIVFANEHYLHFAGATLDTIAGRGWEKLLHPDDAEAHNAAFDEAFRARRPFTYEVRARRADGQYRWLSTSGRPLGRDRFVGVSIDITERRRAEERLRRNNAILQAINLVFSETLGASSEEELARISLHVAENLTGSTIGFLGEIDEATERLGRLHFSDRSRVEHAARRGEGAADLPPGQAELGLAIHGIYGRVLREGRGLIVNDPAADPDRVGTPPGHLPLRAFLGVPLKQGGQVRGMMGLGNREGGYRPEDLEAAETLAPAIWNALRSKRSELQLRDSEARFRQFADASSEVLWIRNADTLEMEFVSQALRTVYGIDPDILGRDIRNWGVHMVPEDRERAFQNLYRVRGGESVVNEFRVMRPSDGAFRWIRSNLFPLRDEQGQVRRIGGLSADTTEAKLQVEHQAVLLAELQHRVRNIMAMMRAIVARTGDHAETVPDYAALLEGRVLTLARVQALLTRAAGAGVPVAAIVHDEVSAQALRAEQYALSGPEIELSPKAAEILTLAVHELATNALKYGALSAPDGCVRVNWATFPEGGETWLGFDWSEDGAPEADRSRADPVPGRRGFGRELIEGRLPYELAGRARLEIGPGGARCRLEFPLRSGPSILDTDAPQRARVYGGSLDMTGKADLSGHRVLVVEDDYYLATDTARALQGAGAQVVGPCPNEEAARAALADAGPTAALIDINLGSGPSFILAHLLRQRNVPFVFVTGYDEGVIPQEFSDVERLQKPVELWRVVKFLAETLRAS
ncbi:MULTISPECIES: GAF domain-containing protein [Methylobacteriaceae]|nr:GAF domain-containing protein [Methylobacterium sp. B4]PXW64102.1 PAS domain S-box-containing protein [Methylobacterium sp. B4]